MVISVKTKIRNQRNIHQIQSFSKNYFQTNIKILYSDNGGEYVALASFRATNGVNHLTSPPHTPQHNGYA